MTTTNINAARRELSEAVAASNSRGRVVPEFAGSLRVVSLTDNGVQCALAGGSPFWLPRFHVQWDGRLEVGQTIMATVPGWLAAKHRQLAGDAAFERAINRVRVECRQTRGPLQRMGTEGRARLSAERRGIPLVKRYAVLSDTPSSLEGAH
jgi:hypothetical protein